jgi:hypothetical protein
MLRDTEDDDCCCCCCACCPNCCTCARSAAISCNTNGSVVACEMDPRGDPCGELVGTCADDEVANCMAAAAAAAASSAGDDMAKREDATAMIDTFDPKPL